MSIHKLQLCFFYLLILFLPSQLALHFWPSWAFINGIRIDYFSPAIYFTDILVILILLTAALERFVHPSKPWRRGAFISFIVFIISIIFINIMFSLRWQVSLYKWIKIGEFAFLVWWVSKNSRYILHSTLYTLHSTFSALLSISVLYTTFLAMAQYFHQGSIGTIFYWLGERNFSGSTPGIAQAVINGALFLRPYATFPHPNVLAGFLGVLFFLLLRNKKKRNDKNEYFLKKIITDASLILCLIGIVLAVSRSTIFVMTVIIIGCLLPKIIPKATKIFPKYIAKVVGVFSVILVVIALWWAGSDLITAGNINAESLKNRYQLASLSVNQITKTPLIGSGLGTSPLLVSKGIFYQPVHNIYLLILSETGFITFIAFITFIIFIFKRPLKRDAYGFKKALILILLTGFFDHYWLTLQQTQLLFVIILGLSWGTAKNDKNYPFR